MSSPSKTETSLSVPRLLRSNMTMFAGSSTSAQVSSAELSRLVLITVIGGSG